MRIFALIVLFIECMIIIPSLGSYGGFPLNTQKITTSIILIFFFINCIIALLCYFYKSKENRTESDWVVIGSLLAIILFIPLNDSNVENKQQAYLEQKQKQYEDRMGNTLTPFYQGRGTEDEQRIQHLREEFVDTYTRNGRQSTGEKYNYRLLCPKIKHSFVTEDQQYIMLTCQNEDDSLNHYAYATHNNGKLIKHYNKFDSFEKNAVREFPYQDLLSENDFSIAYADPIDGTRFGYYQGKLYLIPQYSQTYTDFASQISDQVLQFQQENQALFTNNRVLKLATHLLSSSKCKQVNQAVQVGDNYLIIGCESDSYALNYQKFTDLLNDPVDDPDSVLLFKLPLVDDSGLDDHVQAVINACAKSQQAKMQTNTDFDSTKLREALVDCETDHVWPYNKCVGIYYRQIFETPAGNYFRLDIVHVKEETRVAECVVKVTDNIAAQIGQVIKKRTMF